MEERSAQGMRQHCDAPAALSRSLSNRVLSRRGADVSPMAGAAGAELNPQPSTPHPQPHTLNPTPSTLTPKPLTLSPQPSNPSPQP